MAEQTKQSTEEITRITNELNQNAAEVVTSVDSSLEATTLQNKQITDAAESFTVLNQNMVQLIQDINNIDHQITGLSASNNQIAEMFGIPVEELYGEDYDPDSAALDYLTEKLVVYAIAEKENLSVSDEEYQTYIEEYYPLYGYETQEEYEKDYSPESTKYELLYEKVLSFLLDHSTVIDIPEEEYFDEDFEEADLLSEEDLLEDLAVVRVVWQLFTVHFPLMNVPLGICTGLQQKSLHIIRRKKAEPLAGKK